MYTLYYSSGWQESIWYVLTLVWADAALVFGSQHTVTSMWNIHQRSDSTMCGAQLDQGRNCNTVYSSVQWEIHWSHDQPSNSQEEYVSRVQHYREKKSPLNSGNEEQHNNLPWWACHSMCIPQEYPLHNNIEKHMAYGKSTLDMKCV